MVTFWPGLSRLTPAVTTDWPGLTPLDNTRSLPAAPATVTGTSLTAPFSTTHTEVADFSWNKAVKGTLICGVAVREANCTTAVMPSLASRVSGTVTLAV